MEFDPNKPIYLQIYDSICERVLSGDLKPDDRIPSVREFGAAIGVNPNTVSRSYEKLTDAGIIYTKRGLGYFVGAAARENVLAEARKNFLEKDLPQFLKKASLLGIDLKDLIK